MCPYVSKESDPTLSIVVRRKIHEARLYLDVLRENLTQLQNTVKIDKLNKALHTVIKIYTIISLNLPWLQKVHICTRPYLPIKRFFTTFHLRSIKLLHSYKSSIKMIRDLIYRSQQTNMPRYFLQPLQNLFVCNIHGSSRNDLRLSRVFAQYSRVTVIHHEDRFFVHVQTTDIFHSITKCSRGRTPDIKQDINRSYQERK